MICAWIWLSSEIVWHPLMREVGERGTGKEDISQNLNFFFLSSYFFSYLLDEWELIKKINITIFLYINIVIIVIIIVR